MFVTWEKAAVDAAVAKTTIRGLLGLLGILGVFVVVFVCTGIVSWCDYRREESRLFDDVVHLGYRRPPALANLWRWHETYLVLFVIVSLGAIVVFTERCVVPLIK